ncbi:hypothetical protein [Streptomyces sp. NPDC090025]|uniref:hypothetical protein n=1 Tax=Streptomyces sp. NPDC090025 TaxID=3365922 RepID=UPI003839152F
MRGGQEPAPEAAKAPEEPKTETTLTTRIRINIPGSRPIPPVVVRKPVGDTQGGGFEVPAADRAATAERPAAAEAPAPAPVPAPVPEPEPVAPPAPAPVEEKASDWFAPRKAAPAPAPAAPPVAPAPQTAAAPAPAAPTPGFAGSASGGVPTVGSTTQSMPIVTPLTGAGHTPPGGTPMYDAGPGHTPAAGTPVYDDGYAPSGQAQGQAPGDGQGVGNPLYDDGGPGYDRPGYDGRDTYGNAFGANPAHGNPGHGNPAHGNPGYDNGPAHTPPGGHPIVDATGSPVGPTTSVTGSSPVVGPDRALGVAPRRAEPPRMSDDTAILTPQPPAPAAGPFGGQDQGHVSGNTVTSGMPVVPAGPGGGHGTGPGPDLTPRIPDRQDQHARQAQAPAPKPAPKPAPAAKKAKKKGRSKLVLVGVGVVVLAGVAYGAGLLMNHSDVPKGTTVLGVDIGGGTKDEAVAKLDAALGKRAHAPLQLDIGGKKAELAPDKAGLALDAQETVRAAAGNDYNPVSVIGSLMGGQRVAKPVFPVDEEKLAVALTDLAGASGSATDGTILFAPNKVTPVEGKAGKGVDVQRAMIAVKDAYRAQVETGRPNAIELPVVTRQPSVTKDELERAMEEFAEPAMSANITIKAGGKKIDFGPGRSLPKILSMKAVDGRLVEVYNKEAITDLLDGVFAGIMITKADGSKHEVGADDVAFVMRDALRGKTKAERTKTIDLSGNG